MSEALTPAAVGPVRPGGDPREGMPGPVRARSARLTGLRAFSRNRLAVAGLVTVVVLYVVAILAPVLAPFDPAAQGPLIERWTAPSSTHPLGTDHLSRDVLSRVLFGARISLAVGLVAVLISTTLGVFLGGLAGYAGGWLDGLVMRVVDVMVAFPRLVLLIAVVALFRPSLVLIMVVVGLTEWPTTARLVRSRVLSVRNMAFIQAARGLGYTHARILFRHAIPNALAPAIVAATLGVGHVIVLEAGLSFLGLGVRPPTPSWGSMVADGLRNPETAWWVATYPGLAIVCAVVAFNAVGDGLRDALDPRDRGER
jgi:peptide/nickel transport system permease protein